MLITIIEEVYNTEFTDYMLRYHPGSSTLVLSIVVSSIVVSSTPSSSTTVLSTQLKQCNGYLDSN